MYEKVQCAACYVQRRQAAVLKVLLSIYLDSLIENTAITRKSTVYLDFVVEVIVGGGLQQQKNSTEGGVRELS